MKVAGTLLIMFILLAGITIAQKTVKTDIKLTTFQNIPKEMEGCGNCYYLTEADKKHARFIGVDDFETMLVYINGKPYKFVTDKTSGKSVDTNNNGYTLDFKTIFRKQKDSEYYIFRGIITLRLNSKIVYQQNIIGDGGC